MRRFRTLVDAHRDRVFSLGNLPALTNIALPARLQRKIDNEHWELAATVREEEELVWVRYREDGETVEDMFAVVLADDRLILARLEGDLNELMSKVVSDHHLISAMIPGAD